MAAFTKAETAASMRSRRRLEGIDAPAPGAPGKTPEALSSPLVVNFQQRPDPLAH